MFSTIKMALYVVVAALAVAMITTVTANRFNHYHEQMIFKPQFASLSEREKQLNCLAINIYREAGHEPFEGKVAVAQVTLNRVESGKFAKDICGVVYQKNVFYERVVCQFSWFCDANHRNRPVNKLAYEESYEVAKKVLLENFRLSGLREALFYHADYVNPRWQYEKITKIGRHIFYAEKVK
jgi:spore germination cell wall hydrolase CwlJ-like protein